MVERFSNVALTTLAGSTSRVLLDRDSFVTEKISGQDPLFLIIPSLCNGGEHGPSSFVSISGRVMGQPGRPAFLQSVVTVPSEIGREICDPLLCEVAPVLGAWWGRVSEDQLSVLVAGQIDPVDLPGRPPRTFKPEAGLPQLRAPVDTAVRPYELGWMNYWTNEAAELAGLGEPTDSGDVAELRREGSGWFMKLTHEPFDVRNEEHLERLRAAYRRFPGVGRIPKQ
jgi:hypothetical protein